jgi:hypothetical protein
MLGMTQALAHWNSVLQELKVGLVMTKYSALNRIRFSHFFSLLILNFSDYSMALPLDQPI